MANLKIWLHSRLLVVKEEGCGGLKSPEGHGTSLIAN